jgi:glycosyltransferase involved in cell wall biosynthesis
VDLVVTNIQKEVVIGGLAARLSGIPNIRRIGNRDDLNDRVKWSQKFLVNHSIVPCMATFEEARRRHPWLAPDRFTTVYNGLNPTTYSEGDIAEVRRTWGLTADHLVIGCTSGLAKVKGIDRLISVFAGLCGEYPRARLVLTGEGPEEAELRGQVRQAGIEDGVVFAGFSGETPKVAAAYDISVLNSSLEGFPNVIVEYMAAGRAVISTRVGGVVEIVEHGRNGLLIEPGDDEALGEALRRAMDDPDMRNRLGREARRTVEERFTETSMADSLEAVFSRVAGVDVEEARPEVGDK